MARKKKSKPKVYKPISPTATIYVIQCWNEEEFFYKIGYTTRTVEERFAVFRGHVNMPYKYKIIHQIKLQNVQARQLEKELLAQVYKHHYTPKIPFSGSKRECFSNINKVHIPAWVELRRIR